MSVPSASLRLRPVRLGLGALAIAAATVIGCADARPVIPDDRACPNWQDQVGPVLAASCSSCHGGKSPAAGYDVTTYLGAIGWSPEVGAGAEGRKALHGREDSVVLKVLDPKTATPPHQGFDSVYETLRTWIVGLPNGARCDLRFSRSSMHEPGILDPHQSSEFHGTLAREQAYNLDFCADCHGSDFAGGASGSSCLTCHKKGPTACNSCHGNPPATGAHVAHVQGKTIGRTWDCGECHLKPKDWTEVGHIFLDADRKKLDPTPVELTFGDLAKATPSIKSAAREGDPAWDRTARTCTNVYCHGGIFKDAKAKASVPHWDEPGAGDCGGCHGMPPESHADTDTCDGCHPGIADAKVPQIRDTRRHLDGKVQIGDDSGSKCGACHGTGDGDDSAPPRDLSGSSDPKSLGVGAHQAHLRGTRKIAAPIACAACHTVPAEVFDPGHIDSSVPAEVFPTGKEPLASADGAKPAWNRATGQCSNVYCHGGGKKLGADQAPLVKRSPSWTGGVSEAACGACHGLPPVGDGVHNATMRLTGCFTCHPNTMDANANIKISNGTSKHINGVIDAP